MKKTVCSQLPITAKQATIFMILPEIEPLEANDVKETSINILDF